MLVVGLRCAIMREELIELAEMLEADYFENWDKVAERLRALAARFGK